MNNKVKVDVLVEAMKKEAEKQNGYTAELLRDAAGTMAMLLNVVYNSSDESITAFNFIYGN